MTLYDDLQIVAKNVLADFSQGLIEYGAVTTGAGAVDEPGPSSIAYTTLEGAVARGVQTRYVQQGLAVASDMQVTHSVQVGVVPAQKDFVKIDSVKYKITQVIKKPGAGAVVAYTLILRR